MRRKTIAQTAAHIGVSIDSVWDLIRHGTLKTEIHNGEIHVNSGSLKAYLMQLGVMRRLVKKMTEPTGEARRRLDEAKIRLMEDLREIESKNKKMESTIDYVVVGDRESIPTSLNINDLIVAGDKLREVVNPEIAYELAAAIKKSKKRRIKKNVSPGAKHGET